MALVSIPGPMFWPNVQGEASNPAFGNMLLDAADEKAGAVIPITKAGDIRKIHFRTATVTTGATVDVRLETVDGAGAPSGTLWGTTTNGSQIINALDDNTWFSTTLTADGTVVIGDIVAVAIVNPAGSPGTLNIVRALEAYDDIGVPYTALYTTSWSKNVAKPIIALEYSDGTFAYTGCFPFHAVNTRSFNSGSSPDERGIKFQVPFKCRVIGAWYRGSATTAGTLRFVLFDSGGSELAATPSGAKTIDHDWRVSSTTMPNFFYFTAGATLSINTVYRLTLQPETAVNVGLEEFSVNAAAILDSFQGGQNMHLTTRSGRTGAFTDTTTDRPLMGLIIDQLDDGFGLRARSLIGI